MDISSPHTHRYAVSAAPRGIQGTLAPYQGPWSKTQAAHLARRCLFGPKNSEIAELESLGMIGAVDKLLTLPAALPTPPLNYEVDNEPAVPVGTTWVNEPNIPNTAFRWRKSLRAWWIGLILGPETSILEKMTLFWQNHFGTGLIIYKYPHFAYRHLSLLREHALGNIQSLVEEVTVDPAMLRFLNGNTNEKNAPNENYARELFELFTIGKGPLIAPGNYTTYTEDDVLAAARVLTGWRDRGYFSQTMLPDIEFRANKHDTTDKTFSSAFANQVISDQGDQEYKALIDMIFQQQDTARYICRKLYRWFVYYEIDAQTEADVIDPMATMLVDSGYEIYPVLSALLSSEHFYDANNIGALIKNPVDFFLSPVRQLDAPMPDLSTDLTDRYHMWYKLYLVARDAQMDLLDPPSVAGWPAYYQMPQFHQLWVNSATLPLRIKYTRELTGNGVAYQGLRLKIDPLPWLSEVSDPYDPNVVIEELVALLLPQPLPSVQLDSLKEVLIPGLPDYEWTIEYGEYFGNPSDMALAQAISNKLKNLIQAVLELPECYLS